jgi:hypothetical protein
MGGTELAGVRRVQLSLTWLHAAMSKENAYHSTLSTEVLTANGDPLGGSC